MPDEVVLPGVGRYRLRGAGDAASVPGPPRERIAYAAAHVVAAPDAENVPDAPAVLDWEATLAFRHHLWRHGLGVAEAMDTAQRGMGLDYPAVRELVRRSAAQARSVGGRIVAGVATDQLPAGPATLPSILDAYREQLADVVEAGAVPVLMCSRHLAAAASGVEDYLSVYSTLLAEVSSPVVVHWLGPMFDPALVGYWGSPEPSTAVETVLGLLTEHAERVEGIKVSLLDAGFEVAMRRRLPPGVRMYTGDDFNYPELIAGDEAGHSDALLGVFAAIAPVAGRALHALDAGRREEFHALLDPTVPLARHLFAAPTRFYKTGIVFLAWLGGHQDHFTMVGGLQSGRSPAHLGRLLVLADEAGLLPDASLAAARARAFFSVCGVAQ
ncbi:dihydrodipicolinate synthase family protein [Actinophytocola xanthii]|uniref:Dihydrodipicolinate synthase family protein n=1 Tax=Actinophytocola xanthii TaxID=1912961 RepID=A0A1Q8CT39_9PSEU|nr:dihydrodipicolinate synthase family protein [Actinophytocola xanthii]OLF17532.1 dihydrodipicolinate synthase family protein [Actinophytocola xanthii]